MIIVDKELCPQDHICPLIKLCPKKAISQEEVGLPKIDMDKCIECMICVKNCPIGAVKKTE